MRSCSRFPTLFLTLAVAAAACPAAGAADPLAPGDHAFKIAVDGRQRSYLVHVPPSIDSRKPAPVVLVLHGAATNASMAIQYTGFNGKSDEAGFIAVYPNGTGAGFFLAFNAGGRLGATGSRVDDVKFISCLLDDLAGKVSVDPDRVFATGLSNGGMMCHRLAAELSGRIAAIAPVAGTLALDEVHPERPVPVLQFHGTEDRLVPWNGPGGRGRGRGLFKSVEDTIRTWVKADGCPEEPRVSEEPDRVDDGTKVTRKTYGPGRERAEVILYAIEGGGHTWPGQEPPVGFLGKSTRDISANDIIWEFFQKHPRRSARRFWCDPEHGDPHGDGSAERPWRTIEEMIAAGLIQLRARDGVPSNPGAPVRPGDTVLLRSGWHGVIRIAAGYNDRPITIAAAEGQAPQVGWIEIGEGRRWTVKGLTVSPSLAPAPLDRRPDRLVMLGERGGEESAELAVEDCFIHSVADSSSWRARDWVERPSSGIWLGRHGKGHIARNNYVLNTRFGIELCAPECLCEGNVVANFSADGIRATRDGQTVQYNVIKNNFAGGRDGDDNHDDGIQVFLFNVGTGTLRDMTFRGNIVIAREKDGLPFPNPLQGLGFFDGPLVNFTVEKNVVCVDHWHGITLGDAQGSTVQDNVCFSRWKGEARPWIQLGQKKGQARGNTVRNNLAHTFDFKADAEVKAENNVLVTEAEFRKRLAEIADVIDGKFGKVHPAAGKPRLDP